MQNSKTYLTHDNYLRTFKVEVNRNHVRIFKLLDFNRRKRECDFCTEPLYDREVKRVFVGLSHMNEMTAFSGGHGPKFDGNSILLHEDELTYVYVGRGVQRFQAIAPIVAYESPVGNNDVPYPYAIDSQNNYYLMIENVILSSDIIPQKVDPYDYYYDANLITDDLGCHPHRKPLFGYIRNIKEFWEEYWDYGDRGQGVEYNHGLQKWTWRYRLDYRTKAYDLKNAYVVYDDGTKQDLDPETYISIMEEAEARLGFVRTIDAGGELIHERVSRIFQ